MLIKLNSLSKEIHTNEKCFKIPVEIEEPNFLYFMHYLGNSEQDFMYYESEARQMSSVIARKKASKAEEKLKKYNGRISNYIEKVRLRLHRLNFYECYIEDPLKFAQNFLLQQNGLLRMFKDEADTIDSSSSPPATIDSRKEVIESALKKYFDGTDHLATEAGEQHKE